jgi:hypothetical protein
VYNIKSASRFRVSGGVRRQCAPGVDDDEDGKGGRDGVLFVVSSESDFTVNDDDDDDDEDDGDEDDGDVGHEATAATAEKPIDDYDDRSRDERRRCTERELDS